MSTKKTRRKTSVPSPHFKPINADRKLISRNEAARILGCSAMTLRRMEKANGGTLDVVKLRGPMSMTYFRVEQVNKLFGIDVNAPNKTSKAA